jgi:hypothetical protein
VARSSVDDHDATILGNGVRRNKVMTNTVQRSCSCRNECEQCFKQCIDMSSNEQFRMPLTGPTLYCIEQTSAINPRRILSQTSCDIREYNAECW